MKKVCIEKDQRRIGDMFNRIAPTYDFLNHTLSAGMDLWWRRQAVRSLKLQPQQMVLDVATGTGDFAFAALKDQPRARIVGVDLAYLMLEKAKNKSCANRIPIHHYQPMAGDALHLPFVDSCFDAVMVAYGIRNVPDMEAAFEEFHRVLRPGGQLLILEFSLPTIPLFRSLYLFYFEKILPAIGNRISKDGEAYDYLPASVSAFVSPEEMAKLLPSKRFRVDVIQPLVGGVTYFLKATMQT